ncbi:MAG: 7-cyano-7-deazaguanine synthase, partial [Rhodospirillales bacterium]|nr:7-cyano-7-deazaguanine synthase [Rhodospirillales bacterium]
MAKNAILLLSGGLDSTTLTAMAQAQGFNICALTIDYGQRHNIEIEAARTVART